MGKMVACKRMSAKYIRAAHMYGSHPLGTIALARNASRTHVTRLGGGSRQTGGVTFQLLDTLHCARPTHGPHLLLCMKMRLEGSLSL